MSFTKFQFKSYIREALQELKFTTPTEVQDKLIPIVLAGRDLVGESKTGSGKTHTFLLPIFQQLDEASDSVQAVITAPSRELATQIYQAACQIAAHSDVVDTAWCSNNNMRLIACQFLNLASLIRTTHIINHTNFDI